MVAKSFEIGDLVWAKMKGFSHWPGKVVDAQESPITQKDKKAHHCIFFFGTKNYAMIPDENIEMHDEKLVEKYLPKKKSAHYLIAVETIVQAGKNSSKSQKPLESSFEKIATKDLALPKSISPRTNSVTKKVIKKKVPLKKFLETKKIIRKRASSTDYNGADNIDFVISPSKIQRHDADYSSLFANIPPNNGRESIDDNLGETVDPSTGLLAHPHVERESTPPVDLISENAKLKLKNIVPSKKKIGFLGLGKLGQGMVKNLLMSGHSVTIWNRTLEKCQQFVDIGAEQVGTPSDVIVACDITFCCVSDSEIAKELVFGNCGVSKGLDASKNEMKGYVEMTALDPKTSSTISDEIALHGGRYLEAPLSGASRVQADEGTLFILGAGDKTLFEECESCFLAMGKYALFVGNKVGIASQFNNVHNMLLGTVYAAVAESMALINRVGLLQSDFLDILKYSALNGAVILDKADSMMNQKYTSNTPLKHMQRSLHLGLMLGSSCEQPMPITAAANEVYKHCKLLRYGDHDVSAVYEGTRR